MFLILVDLKLANTANNAPCRFANYVNSVGSNYHKLTKMTKIQFGGEENWGELGLPELPRIDKIQKYMGESHSTGQSREKK